jgi:hypothetical protein
MFGEANVQQEVCLSGRQLSRGQHSTLVQAGCVVLWWRGLGHERILDSSQDPRPRVSGQHGLSDQCCREHYYSRHLHRELYVQGNLFSARA